MVNIVTRSPKHTNHLLHLILTFFTCGAWGFVWVGVVIWNAMTKEKTISTQTPSAWYGPVARPYEVGPGAAVSAQNPPPANWPVPPPPIAPLRPSGVSVFNNGELTFGSRCGHCNACKANATYCAPRDGYQDMPPAPLTLCIHGVPDGVQQNGSVVTCLQCHPLPLPPQAS